MSHQKERVSRCEAIAYYSGVLYHDAGIHNGMDLYFGSDVNPDAKRKVNYSRISYNSHPWSKEPIWEGSHGWIGW